MGESNCGVFANPERDIQICANMKLPIFPDCTDNYCMGEQESCVHNGMHAAERVRSYTVICR